jgi:hypothetical protein
MKKGDFIWIAVLLAITAVLVIPVLQQWFVRSTGEHPYIMGFFKFAIMATMGELLTLRILNKKWSRTTGMFLKTIVWGLVGICIVLMFPLFSEGTAAAVNKGLLTGAPGFAGKLLQAFFTSAFMNLTFAPVFMAAHRISDTFIDMRAEGKQMAGVIDIIDWKGFIRFVVFKTIPFFWIPAHTVTFLLPSQYRVIMAAYLSIALGLLLAYARRRKS